MAKVFVQKIMAAVICLAIGQLVCADEVIMNNGDRLTGTVKTTEGGKLVLETAYAGTIKIALVEIQNIRTDEPIRLVLDDDTELSGIVSAGNGKMLEIVPNDSAEPRAIPHGRVVAINPPPVEAIKITGYANIGFDADRGNTDEDKHHADAETVFRWVDDRVTVAGSFDMAKSNNKKTKEQWDLGGKYDHFVNEKRYLYARQGFEYDQFARLDLRSTSGVGAGYQIFESDRTNLSVEGGPTYIREQFDNSDDKEYGAAHWGLHFDHYLFNAWKLRAFHKHSLDWSLEDSDDYLFKSETGLRVPIIDSLQATVQFNFDRNNAPAGDTKKDVYQTLITGGYSW